MHDPSAQTVDCERRRERRINGGNVEANGIRSITTNHHCTATRSTVVATRARALFCLLFLMQSHSCNRLLLRIASFFFFFCLLLTISSSLCAATNISLVDSVSWANVPIAVSWSVATNGTFVLGVTAASGSGCPANGSYRVLDSKRGKKHTQLWLLFFLTVLFHSVLACPFVCK